MHRYSLLFCLFSASLSFVHACGPVPNSSNGAPRDGLFTTSSPLVRPTPRAQLLNALPTALPQISNKTRVASGASAQTLRIASLLHPDLRPALCDIPNTGSSQKIQSEYSTLIRKRLERSYYGYGGYYYNSYGYSVGEGGPQGQKAPWENGDSPYPATSATSDISVVETTTFNGKIYNNANKPLDGVRVIARSLNSDSAWEGETTTAGGAFAFNDAPSGIQIEIIIQKPGAPARRRVEVLKSNKQGDPNANRYDFGNDGNVTSFSAGYQSLTDEPEVIKVSPGRNSVGASKITPYVLNFSEPMDRTSVEQTFAIYRASTDANDTPIFSQGDFNIVWSHNDTQVTFTPKAGRSLSFPNENPRYIMKFINPNTGESTIKDKSGVARTANHFKLTDGNHEDKTQFSPSSSAPDPMPTPVPTPTPEPQSIPTPTPVATPTPIPTPTPTPMATPLPAPTKVSDFFYFSYDDSASTAGAELIKHQVNSNQSIQNSSVRPWEFLNLESFDHNEGEQAGLFQVSMGMKTAPDIENPLIQKHDLGVHISAPYLCNENRKPMVLTLIADASGSMDEYSQGGVYTQENKKSELMKQALKGLSKQLKPGDIINFIRFSSSAEALLENYQVTETKTRFEQSVENFIISGGTDLNLGIKKGYQLAQKYYDPQKTNRVILLTDAHANAGEVSPDIISNATRINNQEGIYFSGIGFGATFNERFLNTLTEKGKGAYVSVVGEQDARMVFSQRLLSLTYLAAQDVQFKLEFPGILRHGESQAEEISRNAAEVQTTNFSFNTSQYFLEGFKSNATDTIANEKITLILSYKDPQSGQSQTYKVTKTVAEILGKEAENIKAAKMVTLFTDLVSGKRSTKQTKTEFEALN